MKKKNVKTQKIHKTAVIDTDVSIGNGTCIWHFSSIQKGSKIGDGCTIGQNVMVGQDVTIGNKVKMQNNVSVYKGVTIEDDVFCGPSCVFTNVYNPRSFIKRIDKARPTLVKKGATIGANATIICGATIGRYAFIGAGAVVTKDVLDNALCYGNPARPKGWVCDCGVKLSFRNGKAGCKECGKKYREKNSAIEHER